MSTTTTTVGKINDYQGAANVHGHIMENGGDLVPFNVPLPQQPADWPFPVGTDVTFDKVCNGIYCHAENIKKKVVVDP